MTDSHLTIRWKKNFNLRGRRIGRICNAISGGMLLRLRFNRQLAAIETADSHQLVYTLWWFTIGGFFNG